MIEPEMGRQSLTTPPQHLVISTHNYRLRISKHMS
ncbi:hypothetical protein M3J09_008316 [Ascochyta lentis]